MSLFLDTDTGNFFENKTPLPGVKVKWLTVYMLDCSFIFFFFLKPWRNVTVTCLLFFGLTRYKTAENPVSLEQFLSDLENGLLG